MARNKDNETVLPDTIVGGLPSPDKLHKVKHQHFTPDGTITTCVCGWQSNVAANDASFRNQWDAHLKG